MIIKNFILGGIFISFGSYFINEVDAGLAGLLAPMPISIFLYFFIDPNKATDFTITHAIAISVTFLITWLYYYLFLYHKSNQYVTAWIVLLVWFLIIFLIWKFNISKYF